MPADINAREEEYAILTPPSSMIYSGMNVISRLNPMQSLASSDDDAASDFTNITNLDGDEFADDSSNFSISESMSITSILSDRESNDQFEAHHDVAHSYNIGGPIPYAHEYQSNSDNVLSESQQTDQAVPTAADNTGLGVTSGQDEPEINPTWSASQTMLSLFSWFNDLKNSLSSWIATLLALAFTPHVVFVGDWSDESIVDDVSFKILRVYKSATPPAWLKAVIKFMTLVGLEKSHWVPIISGQVPRFMVHGSSNTLPGYKFPRTTRSRLSQWRLNPYASPDLIVIKFDNSADPENTRLLNKIDMVQEVPVLIIGGYKPRRSDYIRARVMTMKLQDPIDSMPVSALQLQDDASLYKSLVSVHRELISGRFLTRISSPKLLIPGSGIVILIAAYSFISVFQAGAEINASQQFTCNVQGENTVLVEQPEYISSSASYWIQMNRQANKYVIHDVTRAGHDSESLNYRAMELANQNSFVTLHTSDSWGKVNVTISLLSGNREVGQQWCIAQFKKNDFSYVLSQLSNFAHTSKGKVSETAEVMSTSISKLYEKEKSIVSADLRAWRELAKETVWPTMRSSAQRTLSYVKNNVILKAANEYAKASKTAKTKWASSVEYYYELVEDGGQAWKVASQRSKKLRKRIGARTLALVDGVKKGWEAANEKYGSNKSTCGTLCELRAKLKRPIDADVRKHATKNAKKLCNNYLPSSSSSKNKQRHCGRRY
ncbi:hypothetical protein V1514DRAFT_332524 [Lipomyces japonicus]|uniref:uncharacterized protein n=1 Tax=Lipomyces japonicus TaxID=56871 RepID=UPI0034CDFF2D